MMIKKLTGILVAVSIFITCMAPVTGFAATTGNQVIFSEGFNASPTYGAAPSVIAVEGGSSSGVVDLGNKNKAFSLGLDHSAGAVSFAAPGSAGVIWYGIRYKAVGTLEGGAFFQLIDGSGAKLNLINVLSYGATLHNGQYFPIVRKNVWTDMHIKMDYTNKCYSVYVNGECVLDNWRITDAIPATARIGFEFVNSDSIGSMEIDHLVVYRGDKVMSNYPEQAYNPAVAEEIEGGEEKVRRLFVHEDFNHYADEDAAYQNKVRFDGIIEARNMTDPDRGYYLDGDLSYLHMEAKDGGDAPKLDIVMTDFNADKYIIDMIINIFELNGRGFLFGLEKGYDSNFKQIMFAESNGVLRLGGKIFNEFTFNRWNRLSFAVDANTSTYDVYIDGVLVREDCGIDGDPKDIDRLTFNFYHIGNGTGKVGIDALAVYAGTELKPGLEEEYYIDDIVNAYNADDPEIQAWIGNKAIYCNTNSSFYHEGEKKKYEGEGYVTVEGIPMGIVEAMAGAYDVTVSFDEATQTATLSNGVTLTVGNDFYVIDGKEVTASGTIAMQDGVLYAPLSTFFEKVLGKTVSYESTWELLYITEDGSKVDVYNTMMNKHIMHLMVFDRMSGDEMANLIAERHPNKAHPRLSATKEEIERVKKNLETDENTRKLYDYLRFNCDVILNSPIIAFGGRATQGEADRMIARDEYISALGHMYQLTGDERYAERAMKELDAILALPPRLESIILGMGPLTLSLTHAYDLFYDYMGEERRARIREVVKDYWTVLMFGYGDANATRWMWTIDTENNFNNNVNAPMLVSALAFVDEPDMTDMAKEIFMGASRSLEYGNEYYAPDGEQPEGPGYWTYTFHQWAPAMMQMKNAIGTTLSMEDHLGLHKAPYYFLDVIGIARFNDYNDNSKGIKHSSRKRINEQIYSMFLFSNLFQDPTIANTWMKNVDNFMINEPGRALLSYDPNLVGAKEMDLDHRYRGMSDYIALRSSWDDDNALLLSATSGQNYASHTHVDGGTYVLDAMGLNWVCDLGTEDYSNPYDPVAGNYYVTGPDAHNVYMINPRPGYLGQDPLAFSSVLDFQTSKRDGYAIVNMQPYYAADVVTAQRGYKLTDDRRSAIVRDEIALKGASEIYSFVNTQADITILDNNTAIFEQFGKKMLVEVSTTGRDLKLEEMKCEFLPQLGKPTLPGSRDTSEYRKLAIKLNAIGTVDITVKFTPLYEDITSTGIDETPLALWDCRDGEVEVPRLTSIALDGKEISDFNPLNSFVEVDMPACAAKAPVITATADEKYNVAVLQGSTDNIMDDVLIKVSEKSNPANAWYYTVHFELTQYAMDSLDGVKLAPIQSIIAEETGVNMTEVLTDRNFETGYYDSSYSNWGNEFMIDLGSVQQVEALISAFKPRHELDYFFFDVCYSEDGVNWKIKTCQKSAGSDGYERVDLGENVRARYIRFTANGRVGDQQFFLNELAVAVK